MTRHNSCRVTHVLAAGLAALCLLFPLSAVAGTCLQDKSEVALGGEKALRFSDLLCTLDKDPQCSIRVQYLRLNGAAASVLLGGGQADWIAKLFGKGTRIVENDVLGTYRHLLKEFGTAEKIKHVGGEDTYFSLTAGKAGEEAYLHGEKGDTISVIALPGKFEFPFVDETLHILNRQDWPENVKLIYFTHMAMDDASALGRITVWRYVTREDLERYGERRKRYNKLVTSKWARAKDMPKMLQFLDHLTKNGWPKTFMYASAPIVDGSECLPLDFTVTGYDYHVEVAVIENRSAKTLSIDQILGRQSGGDSLRVVKDVSPETAQAKRLSQSAIKVGPGEKLVVALRFYLQNRDLADQMVLSDEEKASSAKHYEDIKAGKYGKTLSAELYSNLRGKHVKDKRYGSYSVRKAQSSFTPPQYPVRHNYAFGPEWSLSGITVGGEEVSFWKPPVNFLALTSGFGAGSCPVLYAWNSKRREWQRHGKIIHEAKNRFNEGTQMVSFEGWVPRVRISEEELELAHLDEARALVRLKDGSEHALMPDIGELAQRDQRYMRLVSGQSVVLRFALPNGVAEKSVAETRFVFTGYYERYSDLLVGRMIESQARERAQVRAQ